MAARGGGPTCLRQRDEAVAVLQNVGVAAVDVHILLAGGGLPHVAAEHRIVEGAPGLPKGPAVKLRKALQVEFHAALRLLDDGAIDARHPRLHTRRIRAGQTKRAGPGRYFIFPAW